VLGAAHTVDDGAVITAEKIEDTLRYLLLHEEKISLLFGMKPSAREKKDLAWARGRVNSILREWSGSTLETVRISKKKIVTWVLRAKLAAVGAAVGVGRPVLPFSAVTRTVDEMLA
jgi:hypothetical protein